MGRSEAIRVILSGGGSGGHIFPAIAIADEIRSRMPASSILFVGAKGKMEMEKIPAAGYEIVGLWIRGLQRKLSLSNLLFPVRILFSLIQARRIIRQFSPDLVIGVGGYASGPMVFAAAKKNVPTIIQEQNSYAGLANKWLSKHVNQICVAYKGMEKYFPKEKLVLTGNPVRPDLITRKIDSSEAHKKFGLDASKKTILVVGGSLGARTFNDCLQLAKAEIEEAKNIQWIWQTGKLYYEEFKESETAKLPHVKALKFVDDMAMAYALADVVISRAGALSIAEICALGKASILVPSPNVAEDHQSYNARQLSDHQAAEIISDQEARQKLVQSALHLVLNQDKIDQFEKNAAALGKPEATQHIVDKAMELIG